jgi:hypothetical protein
VEAPAPVTGIEAMLASLDGLASHGLDPAAYGLAGIAALEPDSSERAAAVRSAWLLAATHLRHGALTPDTRTLRTAPDASVSIALDSLPRSARQRPIARRWMALGLHFRPMRPCARSWPPRKRR